MATDLDLGCYGRGAAGNSGRVLRESWKVEAGRKGQTEGTISKAQGREQVVQSVGLLMWGSRQSLKGFIWSFIWEGLYLAYRAKVRFVFQKVSLVTMWRVIRGDQTVGKVICSGDGWAVQAETRVCTRCG